MVSNSIKIENEKKTYEFTIRELYTFMVVGHLKEVHPNQKGYLVGFDLLESQGLIEAVCSEEKIKYQQLQMHLQDMCDTPMKFKPSEFESIHKAMSELAPDIRDKYMLTAKGQEIFNAIASMKIAFTFSHSSEVSLTASDTEDNLEVPHLIDRNELTKTLEEKLKALYPDKTNNVVEEMIHIDLDSPEWKKAKDAALAEAVASGRVKFSAERQAEVEGWLKAQAKEAVAQGSVKIKSDPPFFEDDENWNEALAACRVKVKAEMEGLKDDTYNNGLPK